jgi:hypothetical protein
MFKRGELACKLPNFFPFAGGFFPSKITYSWASR